ncbi:MAG TPA: chromate transporter [Reyranella sp.]|nr:chromate transporter [Reyranella sp.]
MSGLLEEIGATFGWLSLLQFGGTNAVVPEMHRQAVEVLHWMDGQTFANLFALAQLAPGPNVMIVSLIGWRVAGLAGLLVATFAMTVPPSLLAFAMSRLMKRAGTSKWLGIVKDGLVPLAIGMILASGWIMAASSNQGPLSIALTVAAAAFVAFTDYNLLWALGAAIALGLTVHRLVM